MPPWKPRGSARKLLVQSGSRCTERRGLWGGRGREFQPSSARPLQALAWLCDLLPTYGTVLSRVSWLREPGVAGISGSGLKS